MGRGERHNIDIIPNKAIHQYIITRYKELPSLILPQGRATIGESLETLSRIYNKVIQFISIGIGAITLYPIGANLL